MLANKATRGVESGTARRRDSRLAMSNAFWRDMGAKRWPSQQKGHRVSWLRPCHARSGSWEGRRRPTSASKHQHRRAICRMPCVGSYLGNYLGSYLGVHVWGASCWPAPTTCPCLPSGEGRQSCCHQHRTFLRRTFPSFRRLAKATSRTHTDIGGKPPMGPSTVPPLSPERHEPPPGARPQPPGHDAAHQPRSRLPSRHAVSWPPALISPRCIQPR